MHFILIWFKEFSFVYSTFYRSLQIDDFMKKKTVSRLTTINVFVIILRIFTFFVIVVITVLLKQARIRAEDREAERGERRGDQSHREIATATQGAVGA